MQQLMTISYHYTNKFFDTIKLQDLGYRRQQGFGEVEIALRHFGISQSRALGFPGKGCVGLARLYPA
eukprot:681663-Amphidinium_carterae.1